MDRRTLLAAAQAAVIELRGSSPAARPKARTADWKARLARPVAHEGARAWIDEDGERVSIFHRRQAT